MTNQFLAQTKIGKNDLWRYLVTLLATGWVSIGAQFIAVFPAVLLYGVDVLEKLPPLGMLLLAMAPFPFALLAIWGGLRWLHKRPLKSAIFPSGKFDWKKLSISSGTWIALCAISDLILAIINPGNYHLTFDISQFAPYFFVALILIPIQTSTEEIIFRGYLTQAVGQFTKGIWLPLIIPSLIFMMLHSLNPEVDAYGILLTMPFYLSFGLLLGWLTVRTEGLEIAIGIHAANNLYAALLVTFPASSLPSPAVFTIQQYDPLLGLFSFLGMAVLEVFILRIFFSKWFIKENNSEGLEFFSTK